MFPSAGERPHLLTVLSNQAAANDAAGVPIPDWQPVLANNSPLTIWGQIKFLEGRESMQAKQVVAEATHSVRTGYFAGLTPRNRLQYGARTFQIFSIGDPDECRRELYALCKELV